MRAIAACAQAFGNAAPPTGMVVQSESEPFTTNVFIPSQALAPEGTRKCQRSCKQPLPLICSQVRASARHTSTGFCRECAAYALSSMLPAYTCTQAASRTCLRTPAPSSIAHLPGEQETHGASEAHAVGHNMQRALTKSSPVGKMWCLVKRTFLQYALGTFKQKRQGQPCVAVHPRCHSAVVSSGPQHLRATLLHLKPHWRHQSRV